MTTDEAFPGVRLIQPADAQRVYDLLLLAHAENGLFSLSPDKVQKTIIDGLARTRCVIGVSDGPAAADGSATGPVGVIVAVLSQWYYTDDWCLNEITNYVHPDHRRSPHAKNQIGFLKWVADRMGLPCAIGVLSTDQTAAKVRLYARQLPVYGAFFMHNCRQTAMDGSPIRAFTIVHKD